MRPLGYLVSQYPAVNHTFILREIRGLRAMGFDIHVVSIRNPDRSLDALSSEESEEARLTYSVLGQSARQIASAHLRCLLSRPGRYLAGVVYALRLARWSLPETFRHMAYFAEAAVAGDYLARRGVRHLHTHFSSTVALMIGRMYPIAWSATIHGPSEFWDVIGFHMQEKAADATFLATISRFGASQVMAASRPQDWKKIHTLPLGVDLEEFTPRDRPPRTGDTFHVLCVGRLAPVKALHILIDSIGRIVNLGRDDIRLTLIGEGPERASLEEKIASQGLGKHVVLTGACNHDRVIEFYRQADVFAMASFAEGVPVVLMEAMAMAVPCVATWIMGIPELIRDGIDGLLVPPADPESLAAAIVRLMDDSGLRDRLGSAGRLRVIERYNLARNTRCLAEILSAALAGNQS